MATAMIDMEPIQSDLLEPMSGRIAIGKMRAAMMPVTITAETWLKTAKTPRCCELRVESGTIMLWLIL